MIDQKRYILHIDGDSFFASVSQAQDVTLRGKPLITGAERGVATSISIEAKKLGIKRTMPVWEIRKICPQIIIVPGNYEIYSIYSKRMYEIVRRYTAVVEEYSIDECFADITDSLNKNLCTYEEIAKLISDELKDNLGVTFSVGLSSTKVLAKLGSKWNKPYGITIIKEEDRIRYLEQTPLINVWNIGRQTTKLLEGMGMKTAKDLSLLSANIVNSKFDKPLREMWLELNGISAWPVLKDIKKPKSISTTKTFSPPSCLERVVFSHLSKNIEEACRRLRTHDLICKRFIIFLKKHPEFTYKSYEIKLIEPTSDPAEIIKYSQNYFNKVFDSNSDQQYRSSGVYLCDLSPDDYSQTDLFESYKKSKSMDMIYKQIDLIAKKYGKHSVFLGSSLQAISNPRNIRSNKSYTTLKPKLIGETKKRRLGIPFLGMAK